MSIERAIHELLEASIPEISIGHLQGLGVRSPYTAQRGLFELICSAFELTNPHQQIGDAQAFGRQYILDRLHVHRQRYRGVMAGVFDFPADNTGYRRPTEDIPGSAKPYRLRPHVLAATTRAYREALQTYSAQVAGDRHGGVAQTIPNGMPAGLDDRIYVPGVIRLDAQQLESSLWEVTSEMRTLGRGASIEARSRLPTLARSERALLGARRALVEEGGYPNHYTEGSGGRLGPTGRHLIHLSNEDRARILRGSDLWDYDIRSCVWAIFISLGLAYGFRTTCASAYVGDKEYHHRRWARITGHDSAEKFKEAMHVLMMGGRPSSHVDTSLSKLLGVAAADRFLRDLLVQELIEEVSVGRRKILEATPRVRDGGSRGLVNAVGNTLDVDRCRRGRQVAHVLFGCEQFAIRAMCTGIKGLCAIIYDGFIAEQQDVSVLEEKVRRASRERLGFELSIRLKERPLDPSNAEARAQRSAA